MFPGQFIIVLYNTFVVRAVLFENEFHQIGYIYKHS